MGKGRRPCCDKAGVKKGPWSQAEDFKLISFIQNHGHNNWRALPKLAGLARCGKSCRLRWVNYLRPDLKRGEFTPQEEETIIKLHEELGNKWSKIASHFPGRTDNEIKNVWNTHLKKRLKDKGCHEKSTKSSCNTLSTSASTSNEALEESMNLDCHANVPNKHQTITNNNNNDNIEYSSSSSSSYNSQPSSLDHKITDDLNPNPNPLENIGDHKDAASSCTDKKSENLLDELIEIPFEPNLDLWDLLQGDSEVQVKDIDTPMFENDTMKNENTLMQDGGSWWWLVYLENELGLESTLPQSTKATSTLDFFSDISI